MTWDDVLEHSLAQLRWLAEAAERRRAEETLRQFDLTCAAIGVCFGKDGASLHDKFRSQLIRAAGLSNAAEPPSNIAAQARAFAQSITATKAKTKRRKKS